MTPKLDIVIPVYNEGDGVKGAFGAVTTGFDVSSAPFVLVRPADDDYNAFRWAREYFRWFVYAFDTTWLHRKPDTVLLSVDKSAT